MTASDDVFVHVWGAGERVVLVHGSLAPDPAAAWMQQRALADRYQLVVPERRGYGQSSAAAARDFAVPVGDLITLLHSGAHLAGLSYGGVLALLAAGQRPDLVKSLTLIEPPVFGVARGDPVVEELLSRLTRLYRDVPILSPEAFLRGFTAALGEHLPEAIELAPAYRKAVIATMSEPAPYTAEIPYDALARTPFRKLVVSGDWHPAFTRTCDRLAARLCAARVVIAGASHGAQASGHQFNEHFVALLESAAAR